MLSSSQNDTAIQDDIAAETVTMWLHHNIASTVKILFLNSFLSSSQYWLPILQLLLEINKWKN